MNVPDDYQFDGMRGVFGGLRVKPDNGLFYSPIELEAIWALEVELADIFKAREHSFQFHERAHHIGMTSAIADTEPMLDDQRAADLLLRDSLKQEEDPLPPYLHPDCSLDCDQPHIPMPWESGEK